MRSIGSGILNGCPPGTLIGKGCAIGLCIGCGTRTGLPTAGFGLIGKGLAFIGSTFGIGSSIDGILPIDGGLFGKRMTGPRGRDGVNFGGIEIFGSILGICPLNPAFSLFNKLMSNSVEHYLKKHPSSCT